MRKINKRFIQKAIIAAAAGTIIGTVTGIVGAAAFAVLGAVLLILAGVVYVQVKKGREIEPYRLMENIRQASVGAGAGVVFYGLITSRFVLAVFLCAGIALLACALIHAVRTDVLAMEN